MKKTDEKFGCRLTVDDGPASHGLENGISRPETIRHRESVEHIGSSGVQIEIPRATAGRTVRRCLSSKLNQAKSATRFTFACCVDAEEHKISSPLFHDRGSFRHPAYDAPDGRSN